MKSRLTIAISGAILAHLAAGIGLSFFHWEKPPLTSATITPRPEPGPQFMTLPERAELLLTPIAESPPPPAPEVPPEIPEQLQPAPAAMPDMAPTLPPAEDSVAQEQREAAAERERVRILRLEAADKALAEARKQIPLPKKEDTAAPSPPPTAKNKQPARRQPKSKPTQPPAPVSAPRGETRSPVLVRQSHPRYPRTLERKGIGGKVSVMIAIDARGRVSSATVNRSSGHTELDKAAIAAVKKWTFKPALKNGSSIASKTAVDIVFQPEK
ncbi:MAG: TonB family protein [Verrucomicrobiales bacterium]